MFVRTAHNNFLCWHAPSKGHTLVVGPVTSVCALSFNWDWSRHLRLQRSTGKPDFQSFRWLCMVDFAAVTNPVFVESLLHIQHIWFNEPVRRQISSKTKAKNILFGYFNPPNLADWGDKVKNSSVRKKSKTKISQDQARRLSPFMLQLTIWYRLRFCNSRVGWKSRARSGIFTK